MEKSYPVNTDLTSNGENNINFLGCDSYGIIPS